MTLNEIPMLMRSTPLFDNIHPASAEVLAKRGRIRTFRKGSYLFHQEDDSLDVFLLCSGSVEISSISPNGSRQWHTTLEPPQFFGEIGVLGDLPRNTGALAITDSIVWMLKGRDFIDFLCSSADLAKSLLRALARQVHAHGALVDDLLFLDLRGRVAKRLLGLVSASLDELPPSGAVLPLVTHADLASLAGGSRENVSRILSELQKRKMIGRQGRRYVLLDTESLGRLARLNSEG